MGLTHKDYHPSCLSCRHFRKVKRLDRDEDGICMHPDVRATPDDKGVWTFPTALSERAKTRYHLVQREGGGHYIVQDICGEEGRRWNRILPFKRRLANNVAETIDFRIVPKLRLFSAWYDVKVHPRLMRAAAFIAMVWCYVADRARGERHED